MKKMVILFMLSALSQSAWSIDIHETRSEYRILKPNYGGNQVEQLEEELIKVLEQNASIKNDHSFGCRRLSDFKKTRTIINSSKGQLMEIRVEAKYLCSYSW